MEQELTGREARQLEFDEQLRQEEAGYPNTANHVLYVSGHAS